VPIAETLNRVLADTTVLYTHAKFAHWNLKGPEFYALHLLFDEVAETFEGHADEVGERITALGAQAMGTAGMAVENCSLPQMPADAVAGMEYVELLADRVAIHDANLYDAIGTAQGYGDPDTADLLNEISREVSQQLWFLEAHLQTQPVGTVGTGGDVGQGPGVGQRGSGLQQGVGQRGSGLQQGVGQRGSGLQQGVGQQQGPGRQRGALQQQGSFQR
jgi:starvation-inducible DNA-binding protein